MENSDLYRKRAQRRLIAAALAIAIIGGAYWYLSQSGSLAQIASLESLVQKAAVQNIQQPFSAPPPLRAPSSATGAASHQSGNAYTLTRAGVIADTNVQRNGNGGLPALKENATLDRIAASRLEDMFAKQYFAHVSPSGASAQTVASSVGYAYLAIGENLALGNFDGDQGVVAAWMNSPGHRANILNARYTQIGAAVAAGIYEGERTWIAVQIFGRPASDCPGPDVNLKANIDSAEAQLSQMDAQLQSMRAQIEAMEPKRGEAYNEMVDSYNTAVGQYNALAAQVKPLVARYNEEVQQFNACIGS